MATTSSGTDYSRLEPPNRATDVSLLSGLYDFVMNLFGHYLRPILKGLLRITTRLCELQRICYGDQRGGPRTLAVGKGPLGDTCAG